MIRTRIPFRTALLPVAIFSIAAASCSWFTGDPPPGDPQWDQILPAPAVTAEEPVPAEPEMPKATEPVAGVSESAPEAASAPEPAPASETVAPAAETPEPPAPPMAVAAAEPVAPALAAPAEPVAAPAPVIEAAPKAVPGKPAEPKAEAKPVPIPAAAAPALSPAAAPAAEAPPPAPKKPFSRPLDRDVDPVVIKGEQLRTLLGKPISSIRVAAVRTNGLEPVPFQIDERDEDNEYVFTAGPDKGTDRDKGLFDANDELIVMARDLGDQLEGGYPAQKGAQPATVKEIVIRDPIDGKRGYAYVTSWAGEPPAPATKDYVTYKSGEDLVEATSFAVGFNKETPFAIDRSMIRKANGQFSDNRVDILKVRLKSTIFRFYDFDRDQADFGSKTAAWIDGPVRVILHKGISVRMILGLQSPKIWNDTIFYPYGLSYGIDVKTPFKIPSIFSKFEMYSGMDFRDLRGGTFYTNGMSRPVTVTGNPNNPEIAAMNANPDENRFAAIGWEGSYFIMRIKIPPEIPLKVNAYMIDDPNYLDPPERFPGAVPGMYFKIDDWLKVQQTNFNIVTSVFVTDTFVPGQEAKFIGRMDKPPVLENPDR